MNLMIGRWARGSKQLRCAVVLVSCLGALLAARAATKAAIASDVMADHVVSRGVLVDAAGKWSVQDILNKSFDPAPELIARGYKGDATWLRLDVQRALGQPLMLVVTPTFLDDVRLYTQGADGVWIEGRGGDTLPFSSREVPFVQLAWKLDAPIGTSASAGVQRIYLRVVTTSSTLVRARVFSLDGATESESRLLGLAAFLLSINVVLMLVAASRAMVTRDRLWAYVLVFALFGLTQVASFLGLLAKFIWPMHPHACDLAVSLLAAAHLASVNAYLAEFFEAQNAPRWVRWLIRATVLLALPVFALIALGRVREAMQFNSTLLLLGSTWSLVIPWVMKFSDRPTAWMTRFTYTALMVYMLLLTGALLGVQPGANAVMYGSAFSGLFLGVMNYFILTRRDVLRLRRYREIEASEQDARKRLAWVTERRQEAASFLDMLLHELKNPLTSIRLAAANLEHQRAAGHAAVARVQAIQTSVDSIDAVLERSRLVGRVEHDRAVFAPVDVDLSLQLQEWLALRPREEQIRLQVHRPTTLTARIDPFMVRTMVDNLIDNALAYSPPYSSVGVELCDLATSPRTLRLSVRNLPGEVGRPDTHLVFSKYYRAEAAYSRSGAGLGLYLVRSLARLCGGDATHHPHDELVVFEVSLPC